MNYEEVKTGNYASLLLLCDTRWHIFSQCWSLAFKNHLQKSGRFVETYEYDP